MRERKLCDSLLDFISKSPSPYHAVQTVNGMLRTEVLEESQTWNLQRSKFYSVVKFDSSIILFKSPSKRIDKNKLHFKILAAHTDSPCLKLKPNPKPCKEFEQWGVEVYGGVLLNSWLDRDLYIAGKASCHTGSGKVESKLIHLNKSAVRIPQLAIHLDRNVNEGLKLNPETHLSPILGLCQKNSQLQKLLKSSFPGKKINDIFFDLNLYHAQKPSYGGLNQEFIYSSQLDNLAMCHAAVESLKDVGESEHCIPIVCLFDHEEIGSQSNRGAGSTFLKHIIEKVVASLDLNRIQFLDMLSRSFLISADMAHALHPNYPERHDLNHAPQIGKGPVIKKNANQRYTTDSASAAYFSKLCQSAGVPFQNFCSRSDLGCGSTIGPMVAADLGIASVDVGNPMLSMHSIREMAGVEDHLSMIKVFRAFFSDLI